ncbi:HET-domain-containing protein [Annulohypoxylon bovei var. microspora]|nr:HET-domain-containing protein [Annulohypoxylon bovei var. microspora]
MEKFKYDQLYLDRLAFRLVRLQKGSWGEIECEIIHTTLDDNVIPYEAVSYRWGSPMKTASIILQGGRLNVTSNLYLILRDLRDSETDRYLWIDAICINQEDVDERGHQVGRMKDIYSRAERVIFFIGRPTKFTDILMAALSELQSVTSGNNWGYGDDRWDEAWADIQGRLENRHRYARRLFHRALVYLMEQSWFRRVWILQEVGNARSAIVHCGKAFVSARVFAVTPRLLEIKPSSHCQAVFDLMPGPSRKPSRLDRDLYSLLRKFSGAEAQEERDKVYALLGMCRNRKGKDDLIPNYLNPIGDVICDTISYIWHFDIHWKDLIICVAASSWIRIQISR